VQVMTVSYDDLADLIRSRRTHMLVDKAREVPKELVEELCELAQWAPNHKRTWPWRFALFTGEGRARLGEAFVADMIECDFGDEGKRAKTLTKYLRTPSILVIGAAAHDKPSLHDENRDAVAAGIQNMMLAAETLGIATFWGSAPLIDSRRVLELCGFEPDVRLVNVMYLGWAMGNVETPERPAVQLNVIDA
jgi:nitroreductase